MTRDRKEVEVEWTGHALLKLIDTGGYDTTDRRSVRRRHPRAGRARHRRGRRASCSWSTGAPARWPTTTRSPTCCAAPGSPSCSWPTRWTTRATRPALVAFYELGLGEPLALLGRARHGQRRAAGPARRGQPAAVAWRRRGRGRGRAGRDRRWPSSAGPTPASRRCFNAIAGETRTIVSEIAGTTRDAIDSVGELTRPRLPLHRHGRHAQGGQGQRRRVLLLPAQCAEPRPRPRRHHRGRRHDAASASSTSDLPRGHAPRLRHGDRRQQVATSPRPTSTRSPASPRASCASGPR